MRFYDVSKGSIDFLGDKNINLNDLTDQSLRDSIGYVGQ
jgi:ABC-type multidrug transport system fused ATPase/permease subunit